MRHFKQDEVFPYTYLIIRKSDGHMYYGARAMNVKKNRSPKEDLGKFYFTSSSLLKEDFEKNPSDYLFFIDLTFDTKEEAFEFEHRMLIAMEVVKKRYFINMSNGLEHHRFGRESGNKEVDNKIKNSLNKFFESERSIEWRIKTSKRLKENNPAYSYTEEWRNKIKKAMSGENNPRSTFIWITPWGDFASVYLAAAASGINHNKIKSYCLRGNKNEHLYKVGKTTSLSKRKEMLSPILQLIKDQTTFKELGFDVVKKEDYYKKEG